MKNNKNNQQQKVVKKSNTPPPKQQQKVINKQSHTKPVQSNKQQLNNNKQQSNNNKQHKSNQTHIQSNKQPNKQQPPQQPKKVIKKEEPVKEVEEDIEEEVEEENELNNNPLGIDSELYEDITKIQLEIDNIGNKEMQHKLKLDIERDRALTPLYNEREKILSSLPNFWCKVISNHPILSALFTGKDHDLIKNLTTFKVDIMESGNVRFNFTFKNNNFIKNKSIWKEYSFDDQGVSTSCSPIQWKNGNDITKKKEGDEPSFFSWFADQDDLEIFDILKHEVWMFPNEIYYNS